MPSQGDVNPIPPRQTGLMRIDPDGELPRVHPPAWPGDLVAALLVLVGAFVAFPGSGSLVAESPLLLIPALAPIVILPLRRRWPLLILGAIVALSCTLSLLGAPAPGVVLALVIAVFGVAYRNERRVSLIAVAGTIVVVVSVTLVAAAEGLLEPRALQIGLMVAVAGAAGDATRSRSAYIAAVTERARRAEETREAEARRRVSEERLRIARDLHDAVAHQISVISLNAGVASASLESRPEKTKEALVTIRTASRAVLGEIGDLMAVLRAADPAEEQSVMPSPQLGLARLDALVASFAASGLDAAVRIEGDPARLHTAADLVAYRVVQEGLTNALKHGAENRAHVLVRVGDDAARIVVTNPASGEGSRAASDGGGYGLMGLRERVASVRGTTESGLVPGGYRLTATIPLPKETA